MWDKPEQKIFLDSTYWSWNALLFVTEFYIYNYRYIIIILFLWQ